MDIHCRQDVGIRQLDVIGKEIIGQEVSFIVIRSRPFDVVNVRLILNESSVSCHVRRPHEWEVRELLLPVIPTKLPD